MDRKIGINSHKEAIITKELENTILKQHLKELPDILLTLWRDTRIMNALIVDRKGIKLRNANNLGHHKALQLLLLLLFTTSKEEPHTRRVLPNVANSDGKTKT